MDIKKIILIFTIAIIIFGLVLIIVGAAGLGKNKKYTDSTGDSGDNAVIQNTGTPNATETVTPFATASASPATNVPTIDSEKPTLEMSILAGKIKAIAKDDVALAYIEYSWNNEPSKVIEADDENPTILETYIEILSGKNTLKISVVDKTGKKIEKTQEFKGKVLPEIEFFLTSDEESLLIKATCADGLEHVEWRIDNGDLIRIWLDGEHDGVDYSNITKEQWAQIGVTIETSSDGKITHVEYTYKLPEGAQKVTVYAYSLEGEPADKEGQISL